MIMLINAISLGGVSMIMKKMRKKINMNKSLLKDQKNSIHKTESIERSNN